MVKSALQGTGSLVVHRPQLVGNRLHQFPLSRRRTPELPQHRSRRIAHIADSARPARVFHVAKVPHQRRHPALGGSRKPQHLLKLLGAILRLHRVSLLPARPARRHVAAKIHKSPTVNLELLESLVEFFFTKF